MVKGSESGERVFSWDEAKNVTNVAKHGVSFDTAALVFQDPLRSTSSPETFANAEVRWQTVGMVGENSVVLVIHNLVEAEDGREFVHIISARFASKVERRRFETNKGARCPQVLGHGAVPGARSWFERRRR